MTYVSLSPTAASNASCEQSGAATAVVVGARVVVVVGSALPDGAHAVKPNAMDATRRTLEIFTRSIFHIWNQSSGF